MCSHDDDHLPHEGSTAPGGAVWARDAGRVGLADEQLLGVAPGPGAVAMAGSIATGTALVSNGQIGADLISLQAGQRFAPHTHPGDHVLVIVAGLGTLTLDGVVHPTRAGQVLIVDGNVPHAVGAVTEHQIMAIGAPHRAVDALDRMTLVEYRAVLSGAGEMRCVICDLMAAGATETRLHDRGCTHCSCDVCC